MLYQKGKNIKVKKVLVDVNVLMDVIQCISAKTVFCDAIITRNVKDFRKAEIEVYTPEDFLSIII